MEELAAQTAFRDVAILLFLAAALGAVGAFLRQPLVVSFIVVGLLAGPSGFDLVDGTGDVALLSELGIALLLFLVGMRLDVNLIRSHGAVSGLIGLAQVLFTTFLGYAIGWGLGFDPLKAFYVSFGITLSSTIIVVKLLSDKREIDSLHGHMALGILIVQDIVVIAAMIFLSALSVGSVGATESLSVAQIVGGAILVTVAVGLFVRFIANPLTEALARLPELLVCFAIALAAIMAALGEFIGFGKELGGLIAGIALASTPYRDAIAARLSPLRDFLVLFFFVTLGASLEMSQLRDQALSATVLSAFVLVGHPLIVVLIMRSLGFGTRAGFLTGISIAQISEFSLILMGMGLSLGHLGKDTLNLVTLIGMVTIAVSTYLITDSHRLYSLIEPLLKPLEPRSGGRERVNQRTTDDESYDAVIFGLGRFGTAISAGLQKVGTRILGVDFNPIAVRDAQARGMDAIYGDATDPEFLSNLGLTGTKTIIFAIPFHEIGVVDRDSRKGMIQTLRANHFRGRIAVTSHSRAEAERLRAAGADIVLTPFIDAAERAVELLANVER